MKRERKRTHGVITWLNDAELAALQKLTGGTGDEKPSSEWLRDFLLNAARQRPAQLTTLAEVMAIRGMLVNALPLLAAGAMTTELARTISARADGEKYERAAKAIDTPTVPV